MASLLRHKKSPWAAVLAAVIISLSIAVPASADIFRFVDEDGVIHFSNIPAAYGNEKVVNENARKAARLKKEQSSKDSATRATKASYTPPASSSPVDGDTPFADLINAKCDKYGVDPALVRSIIRAESGFNPNALSPKGACGLMQLMPSTASDMGVMDIYDPEQNIEGGVRYFRYLLDNFSGDVELSVAAYNCGEGRVIRNGMCVPNITETKNYVKKVMRLGNNPVTGLSYSRQLYKIELKDGSIMFTDSPDGSSGKLSLVN